MPGPSSTNGVTNATFTTELRETTTTAIERVPAVEISLFVQEHGRDRVQVGPTSITSEVEAARLLARAWESGAFEIERNDTGQYTPHYPWRTPHPRYDYAVTAFGLAALAGVLTDEEQEPYRNVELTTKRQQSSRTRGGLFWCCDLYVNGIKTAFVSDDGHGGEIRIQPYDGTHDLVAVAKRVAAVKLLERINLKVPLELGYYIALLVDEHENEKRLIKRLNGKIIFHDPVSGKDFKQPGPFTATKKAVILADFPRAIIYNETIGKQTPLENVPLEVEHAVCIKRAIRTKTVFIATMDGGEAIRELPARFTAAAKAHILAKHPGARILNETVGHQKAT